GGLLRWSEGRFDARTEHGDALQSAFERRGIQAARLSDAEILEQRERCATSREFGCIGACDARAVACQIDALHGTAARRIALGQPATVQCVEAKAAACEIGELRFGTQAEAEAHCVASDVCFVAAGSLKADARYVLRAFDAVQRHAAHHLDATRL